jgi:exonuclease III
MTGITIYLSILTLNVNGLKSAIKKHHLANWIKMEDWIIFQALSLGESLGEDLPSQWPLKTNRSSNTYLQQSKLQI